jgi:hypothetical protein
MPLLHDDDLCGVVEEGVDLVQTPLFTILLNGIKETVIPINFIPLQHTLPLLQIRGRVHLKNHTHIHSLLLRQHFYQFYLLAAQ